MSDIVERLRACQGILTGDPECNCAEACDEIDRLRAVNAALVEALEHIGDRVRGPNDTLKSDISKIAYGALKRAKETKP